MFKHILGTLLTNESFITLEKNHNAGVLMDIMDKKLVKTTNGLYQLLGPVAFAFPNLLYKECVKCDDIPSGWKFFLTDAATRKTNITARHIHQYKIQEGATSNQKGIDYSEHGSLSKLNIYRLAIVQLRPLIAKTLKKLGNSRKLNTPTDILKYKFHKKMICMYKIMILHVQKEGNIIKNLYIFIIILNF